MAIYRRKRGRAGAQGRWAGTHLWCPFWLPFLHSLLCLILTQDNVSWVVVGRWKSVVSGDMLVDEIV